MTRPKVEPFELVVGFGAVLLLTWALLMAGCNNAELNFYRSMSVTSQAMAGAYKALDAYDDGRVTAILGNPDRDKARSELAKYEHDLRIARQVMGTATDALDATNGGSVLYEDIKAKNWIKGLADLIGLGAPVVDALSQFGIKVSL